MISRITQLTHSTRTQRPPPQTNNMFKLASSRLSMGASSARPFTTLKQLQLQAPFLAQRHTVGFESALQRSDRERKEATAAKLAQLSAAHHERRISIILDANVLNFLVAHGVRVNPAQLVATEQGW
eukprot:19459-Heterococcus_DN1.PRE.1